MENLKLIANSQDLPLRALIVSELIKSSKKVKITIELIEEWEKPTNIELSNDKGFLADWDTSVARMLSEWLAPELAGGDSCLEKSQVDSWINFAKVKLANKEPSRGALEYLNKTLSTITYLVGKRLTLADIYVFSKIYKMEIIINKKYDHIKRWSKQIFSLPEVKKYTTDKGQFIELPGAEFDNLKVIANSQDLPLGALIVSELINSSKKVKITIELIKEWKKPTNIELSNDKEILSDWEPSIINFLSDELAPELAGGESRLEKCQVNSWINFLDEQVANEELSESDLVFLNENFSEKTYLVGKRLTLADIYIFLKINKMEINKKYDHIKRWSKHILSLPEAKKYTGSSSSSTDENNDKTKKPAVSTKDGPGQCIELPGAEFDNLKIIANSKDLPLGALIVSELINSSKKVTITVELLEEWKKPTNIELNNDKGFLADTETSVTRILSQQFAQELAWGDSHLEKSKVDFWIKTTSRQLANKELSENALEISNRTLSTKTYLLGQQLTVADVYVFSKIYKMEINEKYDHIKRWSKQILSLPEVKKYIGASSTDKNNQKTKKPAVTKKDGPGKKEQGQFIEVPGVKFDNLKVIATLQDLPLGALIVSELIKSSKKVKITIELIKEWKKPTNIELSNEKGFLADTETSVARILSQQVAPELAGGDSCLEKCRVNSWIRFAKGELDNQELSEDDLIKLNEALSTTTYLDGEQLTLADIYVFSKIYKMEIIINEKYDHIKRWYKHMLSLPEVGKYIKIIAITKVRGPGNKEQEQFNEIPGAEMGREVFCFSPKACAYLHIGHAKAALLNQHYAQAYKGKLIVRFDDTNPAKENVEFEQAILEDLKLLEIKPDRFTHSSDYFKTLLKHCTFLIKKGKAYADDTPADLMRDQLEKKEPSANRDNSVDKNTKMWDEMKAGSEKRQKCCIRAKISLDGAMIDPIIYRCKPEPHPKTGKNYKVYPTYDFACPIIDSIEDVTLALKTTEYLAKEFYWSIDALSLRRPYIWTYSRLNMTNTVLSKRKLTWFVNEGLVDGCDDPRFPTVRGIVRRGMTVEGLKQFIIAQDSSKSVVFMEWDKIWAFNKKVIDPIAVRYTALNNNELVPVKIDGATDDTLTVQNHPKDPSIGTKKIKVGANILIERTDAETLVEGNNATFVHWGNILIQKINKKNGVITSVDGKLNLENKDYKNTVKLTWLFDDRSDKSSSDKSVPCYAVYFDHIISKAVLGKDDDFKNFVGKDTRKKVKLMGESELTRVKKGEIIQLQRKGFFRCDVPYMPVSGFTSCEQPLVLFHIPDGHSTASAAPKKTETKKSVTSVSKESSPSGSSADELSSKIAAQGEKIRQLKADKAEKAVITLEVSLLLKLKSDYKSATGQDWKPSPVTASSNNSADDILSKIADQGEKVRQLKSAKADKAVVTEAVAVLLKLKDEYKKVTGQDWKPTAVKKETPSSTTSEKQVVSSNNQASGVESDLSKKVETQGNKVRELKSAKADKATVTEAVGVLLKLKEEYKKATGQDWKPPAVTKEAPSSSATSEKQMASTNNQASGLDNASAV